MIQNKFKEPEKCVHEITLTRTELLNALFPTVGNPRPGWNLTYKVEYDDVEGDDCLILRFSKRTADLAEEADILEFKNL